MSVRAVSPRFRPHCIIRLQALKVFSEESLPQYFSSMQRLHDNLRVVPVNLTLHRGLKVFSILKTACLNWSPKTKMAWFTMNSCFLLFETHFYLSWKVWLCFFFFSLYVSLRHPGHEILSCKTCVHLRLRAPVCEHLQVVLNLPPSLLALSHDSVVGPL